MIRQLYAGKDIEPSGYTPITEDQAQEFNQKGYGIFWTVNEFDGPRRKANLKRLNSWYVEMDQEPKEVQMSRIELSPVLPTLIVESKRGFQIYWDCIQGKATVDNYKRILEGLQKYFSADENAKDITRLLRAPGYLHLKNPSQPFKVELIYKYDGHNSDALMKYHFVEEETPRAKNKRELMVVQGADFWSKAMSLDCEIALRRLSGTNYVNREHFTFKPTSNGNQNIYVNGKSCSAWIDQNKKIGSSSKGGPGIAQWLHWYGHSYSEVRQILLDVFPEVR